MKYLITLRADNLVVTFSLNENDEVQSFKDAWRARGLFFTITTKDNIQVSYDLSKFFTAEIREKSK